MCPVSGKQCKRVDSLTKLLPMKVAYIEHAWYIISADQAIAVTIIIEK